MKNEPDPEKDGSDEKKNAVGGVPCEEREPLHYELHLATCSEEGREEQSVLLFLVPGCRRVFCPFYAVKGCSRRYSLPSTTS